MNVIAIGTQGCSGAVVEYLLPNFKYFSVTPPENCGAENSTENSGLHAKNFFCFMYESSLRHPVRVPEINVKSCNRRNCLKEHRKKIAKILMRTFTCRSTSMHLTKMKQGYADVKVLNEDEGNHSTRQNHQNLDRGS